VTSPIYIALDTPDLERARTIAKLVKRHAGGLKLGLEFFAANGPAGVTEIAHLGLPIFLDLKLHDIPNTVAKAIHALRLLEPAVLTVHAAGGRAMLEEAKAAAPSSTKVVAVTVLTSLDGRDLTDIGVGDKPDAQVSRLAELARTSGLDGIVCSGAEVAAVHRDWHDGFFVVPGVRPADGQSADQKRVITPRGAIDAGASILVIGRPVTEAEDPDAALRAIAATL
jgi:orotidine-5'-phosphate decarboxylase